VVNDAAAAIAAAKTNLFIGDPPINVRDNSIPARLSISRAQTRCGLSFFYKLKYKPRLFWTRQT
jgi:hypothetical protein